MREFVEGVSGSIHDKAILDRSGLAALISYQPPGSMGRRQRIIMGDLGYVGITGTSPGSVLPQK
jgi:hypothetical protein